MNSLSDARISSRRLPGRGVALLLGLSLAAGVLCLLALVLALRQGEGLGLLALLLTGLCTALVLLVVAALAWHIGVRLTRQQLSEALREARMQAQMLAQLQPHCQWASDAQHRLVRWQAPQAVLSSRWAGAAAPQALWERFGLLDGGAQPLRELLETQAAHLDLQIVCGDGSGARWRLRAIACSDEQGRFSGYCGTAEALPQASHADSDRRWMEALPGPAWLLADDASAKGDGKVLAQNSQAAALSAGAGAVGASWADCLSRLPEPVAAAMAVQAAQNPGPPNSFADEGGSYKLLALWPQSAQAGPLARPESGMSPQAQQMAHEHESFSFTVSHDLRAPLRVVEGFTRILKEDYGRLLDRIGNDHLDRVMGAAARMNSMIDSLLSLAQLSAQPLARQPVNLSQLAGFVVEELARSSPERKVHVHIQPHMLVQGDPTLLRMVLENLLGNAWKYSGKCMQPIIRFEAQQEDGKWIYRVSDNGAGFDMRFADRLFGVFQRLHSASEFQGTGVGLASVRRIVRRHGGEIWAEAVVGEGAQFYFTLAG
ncbi:GHKL domain-containing protein [Paucibacter sp. TC2R-5]|uniref:sensor histidine kinase n=1 Tax=Paucibacter sp. TC2R-5 TaxID=2893555 RepID=UPI0021E4B9C6|nr:ATP-binding protein [Paucibacter sp. TC2R-5]MCV2359226.1 GHKL domain-containing protein [Paucibacter sp. TC2R-5]